jgi:hypothetical protein
MAQLKTKTRVEKSGLSLIASVEFYTRGPTQGHKIRVIWAYLPPRGGDKGPHTMVSRLASSLGKMKFQALRTVLGKWITKRITDGYFVIVGGDFNGVMDTLEKGKQPYIHP